MSNATANRIYRPVGKEGRNLNLPVDGEAHIYGGTLVSQLNATSMLVPGTTASSGPAVGVATHEVDATGAADGAKRCLVHSDRIFLFACGTGGDAVSEATPLFSPLYMTDDHTVSADPGSSSATRQLAGLYCGTTDDGLIMVYVGHFAVAIVRGAKSVVGTLPAFASADCAPTDLINGAIYDIPTTAANSTVTLPAAAAYDGIHVTFVADGTKNGHTVQYRDATGPVNITAALTASKRHMITVTALGGLWFAPSVSP